MALFKGSKGRLIQTEHIAVVERQSKFELTATYPEIKETSGVMLYLNGGGHKWLPDPEGAELEQWLVEQAQRDAPVDYIALMNEVRPSTPRPTYEMLRENVGEGAP